jgi:hypothetical protein
MKSNLTIFLQDYWKYIAAFLLGLFLASLIPMTPIGKTLIEDYYFTQSKKEEITKLKEKAAYYEGQNSILEIEKTKYEKQLIILESERDSLKTELKDTDDKLIIIEGKYKDLNKINNLSDKELYEFFKNIKNK